MRGFVFYTVIVSSVFAGSALFAAQSSGIVGSYDRAAQSFWINGDKYQLTQESRRTPHNGERVAVSWEQGQDVRLVRSFTVEQLPSDDN